jgi:hypothetical protein
MRRSPGTAAIKDDATRVKAWFGRKRGSIKVRSAWRKGPFFALLLAHHRL